MEYEKKKKKKRKNKKKINNKSTKIYFSVTRFPCASGGLSITGLIENRSLEERNETRTRGKKKKEKKRGGKKEEEEETNK